MLNRSQKLFVFYVDRRTIKSALVISENFGLSDDDAAEHFFTLIAIIQKQ